MNKSNRIYSSFSPRADPWPSLGHRRAGCLWRKGFIRLRPDLSESRDYAGQAVHSYHALSSLPVLAWAGLLLLICHPAVIRAATNIQSWTSSSSYEGPRHTASSTASGAVTRIKQGVSWETERQGVVDGDKEWQSITTGSGTKTDTGYERSSTTKGTTENGKTWTTEHQAEAVKNDDGTVTIDRNATKTLEHGTTITRESQTVVTKTEDGKTWETTGTSTGPKGTSTMSGSGAAVKTDDGVNVNINRQGTTAGSSLLRRSKPTGYEGREDWKSTTTGSGTKTDTGRKWGSTTDGAAEGGKTWKKTSEGELKKSGANVEIRHKRALKTQSPDSSGSKNVKSGSRYKRSGRKTGR